MLSRNLIFASTLFAVCIVGQADAEDLFGGSDVTPCEIAVKRGRVTNLRKQISKNPSIAFTKNLTGETLLHDAAMFGQVEVAKLLLLSGARVNAKDQNGRTPLHFVCYAPKHAESLTRLLIESRADLNAVDVDGNTPLDFIAGEGRSVEVARILWNKGANIYHRNNSGETLLGHASASGSTKMISFFLRLHADVSARDGLGQSPLHLAMISRPNPAAVRLLLANGANIESRGGIAGQTPLFYAAKKGYLSVARILISHGANINATDDYSMTPLLEAAQNGHISMVKMLLRRGANVKAQNVYHQTADQLADAFDYPLLAHFLRDYHRR